VQLSQRYFLLQLLLFVGLARENFKVTAQLSCGASIKYFRFYLMFSCCNPSEMFLQVCLGLKQRYVGEPGLLGLFPSIKITEINMYDN
jgi:hypothetical protein